MIRKTLTATKAATYSLDLPDSNDMPSPNGTGFFVSPDGHFVTARHVIEGPNGSVRTDVPSAWLTQAQVLKNGAFVGGGMCQWPEVVFDDPETDFALLKVDFQKNQTKAHLTGLTSFPYLQISVRELEEGEPVYAYGYPLSESQSANLGPVSVGMRRFSPRVTSAVVSSTIEQTRGLMHSDQTRVYAIDKALNYGNSGGPIVATESGKVHAFCSRFQPVSIPQPNQAASVWIPSLYGIMTSLGSKRVLEALKAHRVPVSEE